MKNKKYGMLPPDIKRHNQSKIMIFILALDMSIVCQPFNP